MVFWAKISRWFGRFHYSMSGRTEYGTGDLALYLSAALLAAALLILAVFLIIRRRRAKRLPNPRRLFKELCRAHRLDRLSRRRLWRLARTACPEQPARMFLEPEKLDFRLCQRKLQMSRDEVVSLRRKLFNEPLADPISLRNRSLARTAGEEERDPNQLPDFQPSPSEDVIWRPETSAP